MKLSDLQNALAQLLLALISRTLITPLSWLIPRDPERWLVIGREHGKFLDNAKHFFCWVHSYKHDACRISFLTEHPQTAQLLSDMGVEVVRYPRPSGMWALLRAGTIVIDTVDHIDHGRIGFMSGARIVQLWHGAPLKEIEIPLHERRLARLTPPKRAMLRMLKAIIGRYQCVDFLVSTSEFFTCHAFIKCFRVKRIVNTGYPRNDVIPDGKEHQDGLIMANVDVRARSRIQAARAKGKKVVLYSPTFRKDRHSPFHAGGVDLVYWSRMAEQHHYLLVLKLHPLMSGLYEGFESDSVIDVDADSDIYPLLQHVDLMITDYSSIFFDFLLMDRPILYFAYDLEHYTSADRHLFFDYAGMTPGSKLCNFDSLLTAIPESLEHPGTWASERARVRDLVFDQRDSHASQRIWDALQKE